jgi:thiamine-monophosphate kinase
VSDGAANRRRAAPGNGPRAAALAHLGEFQLIGELARLVQGPPPAGLVVGIGDDAAAWAPTAGLCQVATTDVLVEGVHFRLDWTSLADLGWKALAVNLSDLAAMGATPRWALVALALPPERRQLAVELYRGLARLARETGTAVVGGDTVRSPGPLVISIALLGEAEPQRLLRRDAAQPGDLLVVTGTVGASAAGLALLQEATAGVEAYPSSRGGVHQGSSMEKVHSPSPPPPPGAEVAGPGRDPASVAPLLAAHHRPIPRLTMGRLLAAHGVRCAIDISDGLASEAEHLAEASGVAVELDLDRIPLHPAAVALWGKERARRLALSGGEDYELLFAAPPSVVATLTHLPDLPVPLTVIGRVGETVEGGRLVLLQEGRPVSLEEKGYVAF